MEEKNEAWKMLLESLEDKDNQIIELRKKEIVFLQKLMDTEDNVKGLIKVIAELKFPPKIPKKLEQEETTSTEEK